MTLTLMAMDFHTRHRIASWNGCSDEMFDDCDAEELDDEDALGQGGTRG